MTEITAAKVLGRYNYETTDFDPDEDETTSLTNVEYIIDDVIDFINAEAGTSMSNMAGVAGSKTVTVTGAQNAAIKMVLPVVLKETKYKTSVSSGLGPASMSESVGSQDRIFRDMFWRAISRLRGRSFLRV